MASEFEIEIPTFINIHLFWIIEKRNTLVQSGIDKYLRNLDLHLVQNIKELWDEEIVATNVNNIWARAVIVFKESQSSTFVCWLIDYAVLHMAKEFYKLPRDLEKCPPLARQASLYNVVNLQLDFNLNINLIPVYSKTLSHDNGIRIASLDFINKAKKLFLSVQKEEDSVLFGDIICEIDGARQCLTEQLIETNFLAIDEEMFKMAQEKIESWKNNYFLNANNWQVCVINKEKNNCDTDILFNTEENSAPIEYFESTSTSLEISDSILNISYNSEDNSDFSIDITVPTFLNPFLFWIINKSDIHLRLEIERCLNNEMKTKIDYNEKFDTDQIVAIKMSNDKWARVKVINVININGNSDILQNIFVCWLIDYGCLRTASEIYQIINPHLGSFPAIAKEASLYNVVYLIEDVRIDEIEKKSVVKQIKTVNEVETTTNKILDILKNSKSIYFIKQNENDIIYGDLIVNYENEQESLVKILIEQKLMETDEVMFENIRKNLESIKMKFFNDSRNWQKELVLNEQVDFADEIINDQENTDPIEYFQEICSEIKNCKLSDDRSCSSISSNSDNY